MKKEMNFKKLSWLFLVISLIFLSFTIGHIVGENKINRDVFVVGKVIGCQFTVDYFIKYYHDNKQNSSELINFIYTDNLDSLVKELKK